jgi:thiol-disulfide isomerase/thioredoxin
MQYNPYRMLNRFPKRRSFGCCQYLWDMKKLRTLLLIVLPAVLGNDLHAQKINAVNSGQLLERVAHNDTLYIVNFWATWCLPCVKELPSFSVIHDLYAGKPVKVLLLSFDFKENYPRRLEQWVSNKKLSPEVLWFNEANPTEYIPRIAPEWEGALPATLLINNRTQERKLIQGEVSSELLKGWLEQQSL